MSDAVVVTYTSIDERCNTVDCLGCGIDASMVESAAFLPQKGMAGS